MYCRRHPDHNGVNTCNQCGEWLCEDCTVEINGRNFCRSCLKELAKEPKPYTSDYNDKNEKNDDEPGYYAPKRRHTGMHRVSGLMVLIFSCLPGVNYMYMGLIKRGLVALLGFFLLVYMTAQFRFWPISMLMGLSFPVYILACTFDAFNTRRRINAGEHVEDNIDDIISFIKRNKHILIGFLVLIIALSLINTAYSALPYSIRRIIPITVVALGLYLLAKKPQKKKDKEKN